MLVFLLKLRSPVKAFYSTATFGHLQKALNEFPPVLEVGLSAPPDCLLHEAPSKRFCGWLAALMWMFNIDDLGFAEELYEGVEKEITDLRSKIKKDNDKIK